MKVIILAGGFATRLWPITEQRAKPLLLINGKEQISHIVETLPQDVDIYISTNAVFQDDFREWAQRCFPERNISVYVEDSSSEAKKLGPVKAINYCITDNKIDDDLLVVAGDNFFGFPLSQMIDDFDGSANVNAVYKLNTLQEAQKFGIANIQNGMIESFEEKPKEPKSLMASTACYIFRKEDVGLLQKRFGLDDTVYELGDILSYLINEEKKPFIAYQFDSFWYDIGSFQSYIDAHKEIHGGKSIIDDTAQIQDSSIQGSVYIGPNTLLENCVIEDSLVFGSTVLKDCTIRGSIIDT
ncbi:MAG: sugar phosphate nucleotidyltransferase, partial [Patescibacteria group bacterium]|nr:sugar phosphate nucleotidyltransferase [Patescibacteria group bacterium]